MVDQVETKTAEEMNQFFQSCADSVHLINSIINEDSDCPYLEDSIEERKEHVQRNVDHLKICIERTYYINDNVSRTAPADKASIEAAISSGEAYVA